MITNTTNTMTRYFLICAWSVMIAVPVVAQKPNEALLRAKAAMQQQQYAKATQEILTVPDHERTPAMYLVLGESAYFSGNYGEAISVFESDRVKNLPEAQLYAARACAMTDQPARAAAYLQKYLEQREKLSESELQLDPALEKMERSREWRMLWQKEWYNAAEQQAAEAMTLVRRKKYAEALEVIDKALANRSSSGKLYAVRAKVYEAMESYEPALESYQSAIQLRGNDPALHAGASEMAVRLKKYELALEHAQRAVRLDPYRLEGYLQRAAVYRLLKQYEEAHKDIDFYFTYLPADTKALYQMGLTETEAGRPLSGIEYFTLLIERDKTSAEYFAARAAACIKAGRYGQADDDLAQALDLNPRLPDAWLQKGIALQQMDDAGEACHCWQKAMLLGSREAATYIYKYCAR
ncbi:MAG: tetratricopeptide repeat protein [Bacteroidales bacterium]|jgi:tetratricopeptide (TPR) repeat protein|nr:tetratricopeptide repeat protein [Bacteroidales bacterium]